jgi:hypothetical protein
MHRRLQLVPNIRGNTAASRISGDPTFEAKVGTFNLPAIAHINTTRQLLSRDSGWHTDQRVDQLYHPQRQHEPSIAEIHHHIQSSSVDTRVVSWLKKQPFFGSVVLFEVPLRSVDDGVGNKWGEGKGKTWSQIRMKTYCVSGMLPTVCYLRERYVCDKGGLCLT